MIDQTKSDDGNTEKYEIIAPPQKYKLTQNEHGLHMVSCDQDMATAQHISKLCGFCGQYREKCISSLQFALLC